MVITRLVGWGIVPVRWGQRQLWKLNCTMQPDIKVELKNGYAGFRAEARSCRSCRPRLHDETKRIHCTDMKLKPADTMNCALTPALKVVGERLDRLVGRARGAS